MTRLLMLPLQLLLLTLHHTAAIDVIDCSKAAPNATIAEVKELIEGKAVVVFGFGPCPCTDFARERFDTLGICYAEMVQPMLYTNDEPHLKYLQCKYGPVHSFTFIGGELVGDNRGMIDKDTIPADELVGLLNDAGASYNCPKDTDQIHHPLFLDPYSVQLSQVSANVKHPAALRAAGAVVREEPANQPQSRLAEEQTSIGIATFASVGTLVVASLISVGRQLSPRVVRWVRGTSHMDSEGQAGVGVVSAAASQSVGNILAADSHSLTPSTLDNADGTVSI